MKLQSLATALRPLAALADAFDAGRLVFEGGTGENPAETQLYSGRGGTCLLTLQHALDARRAIETGAGLEEAAEPFRQISRAYDANELDDEARKFVGAGMSKNTTPPDEAPLVHSQGGAMLLSLGEALSGYYALLEHNDRMRRAA